MSGGAWEGEIEFEREDRMDLLLNAAFCDREATQTNLALISLSRQSCLGVHAVRQFYGRRCQPGC